MRRKCFSVSSQAEAAQRSTIAESRQRVTLCVRRRTPLWGLSMRLVVARHLWSDGGGALFDYAHVVRSHPSQLQTPSKLAGWRTASNLIIARLMALAIRFEGLVRDKKIRDYAELARVGVRTVNQRAGNRRALENGRGSSLKQPETNSVATPVSIQRRGVMTISPA
jgi:hypothetical protein